MTSKIFHGTGRTCIVLGILVAASSTQQVLAANMLAAEVVRLVRDRFESNYAPIKTIQAKVTEVVVTPGIKEESTAKSDDDVGLSFTISPRSEFKWDVKIAGLDERYEDRIFGSDITRIRRGNLEFEYVHGEYAYLSRRLPENLRATRQYDPREAMFTARDASVATLLAGDVRSAEMVARDGQRFARIVAKGANEFAYMLECPESAGFLPTQVYAIDDRPPESKGIVQIGTTVEYGQYTVDGRTVLFPKRIFKNYAGSTMPRTTNGYMQRVGHQTVTVTINDLKLNEPLPADAFVAPDMPRNVRFHSDVGDDLSQVPAELLERVAESERLNRESQERHKRLTAPIEAMIGKPAPALPDTGWIGGERPNVTGKPYLMAFWAVWCGPCKYDMPRLRKMAAAETQVVGMHPFGTPSDEIAKFIQEHKLGYVTLLPTEDKRIAGVPQIAGFPAHTFPYYILVDAKGRVAAHGQLEAMSTMLDEWSATEASNAK